MAQVRRVLRHVRVETAKGKRRCARNAAHSIAKGCRCLAVSEGPMAGDKNYCPECAAEILAKAELDLVSFRGDLGGVSR